MAFDQYPEQYLVENQKTSKQLNVVFEMEGAEDYFSIQGTQRAAVWGQEGLVWGEPGLVWGGDAVDPRANQFILLESNLVIDQRVEPEQGRGSTSLMSFVFLDVDGYVTRFFSPGQVVDEPVGNKLVKVRVGYANTNYPDDYFTVFRGYVSSVSSVATKTYVQLSDPNLKRRQQVFLQGTTALTAEINSAVTNIPVVTTEDFYQQVLGPDGNYDSTVKTYIKIDDEIMEYGPTGIGATSFTVTRGARGTTAASHDVDAEVSALAELGPDNAIDIALKIQLSGWEGPWKTDQQIASIQITNSDLGDVANALVLPPGIDGLDDLGIVSGDYWTISGSTEGNNGQYIVQGVQDLNGRPNAMVTFTSNFVAPEEGNDLLLAALRSKYDTYPDLMSTRLTPAEVDVPTFQNIRDSNFAYPGYDMQFFITGPESGKVFIEKEIMLPLGAYSITRLGKLSMNITQPPLPDSNVQTLSVNNILKPETIKVERSTNNRRYFNEIQYQYNQDDDGEFLTTKVIFDASSLSRINILSVLPIPSKGMRSTLESEVAINQRGNFLITRYANIALYIELKCNWKVGSIVETGDSIILQDDGTLHIANYGTGELNIGRMIWEVIMCRKDIKSGEVTLGLLSGTGFYTDTRYATFAPSSLVVGSGSTTTTVEIQDSFGELFPGDEQKKWTPIIGERILIHNYDYSHQYEVTLTGFDPTNRYKMFVTPALPVAPSDDWIVDCAPYPTDESLTDQLNTKLYFASFSATVPIVDAISDFELEVASSDIGNFKVGNTCYFRNASFSVISDPVEILTVATDTNIITTVPFNVSPSDGDYIEGMGFLDSGKSYVYV